MISFCLILMIKLHHLQNATAEAPEKSLGTWALPAFQILIHTKSMGFWRSKHSNAISTSTFIDLFPTTQMNSIDARACAIFTV